MILRSVVFCVLFVLLCCRKSSASSSASPLYFFVHSDWGKGGYDGFQYRRLSNETDQAGSGIADEEERELGENKVYYQGEIAQAMAGVASETLPSFIMALGDNFYANGVASTTDSLWKSMFRTVYFNNPYFGNKYILQGIPWHPAFGNHDLGYGDTGIQAQIDRTSATTNDDNGEWQFPSPYYTVSYDIPGGGFVQVIVVDTTTLSPSVAKSTSQASTETQSALIQAQAAYLYEILEKTLVSPRPTWLLVMGHYQIFSKGEKGDNSELYNYLQPFLAHYGVHAYFCGHDHMNEHLQFGDIEYFVAGSSTMTNSLKSGVSSAASLVWVGEGYAAFTRITATTSTLTVDYVNTAGSIVYTYSLKNPNASDKSSSSSGDDRDTAPGTSQTESPPLVQTIVTGAKYAFAAAAIGFAAFQVWIYWMFSGLGSEYKHIQNHIQNQNRQVKNSYHGSEDSGASPEQWTAPQESWMVPDPAQTHLTLSSIDMSWNSNLENGHATRRSLETPFSAAATPGWSRHSGSRSAGGGGSYSSRSDGSSSRHSAQVDDLQWRDNIRHKFLVSVPAPAPAPARVSGGRPRRLSNTSNASTGNVSQRADRMGTPRNTYTGGSRHSFNQLLQQVDQQWEDRSYRPSTSTGGEEMARSQRPKMSVSNIV